MEGPHVQSLKSKSARDEMVIALWEARTCSSGRSTIPGRKALSKKKSKLTGVFFVRLVRIDVVGYKNLPS